MGNRSIPKMGRTKKKVQITAMMNTEASRTCWRLDNSMIDNKRCTTKSEKKKIIMKN